jgi:hypothetical protein
MINLQTKDFFRVDLEIDLLIAHASAYDRMQGANAAKVQLFQFKVKL